MTVETSHGKRRPRVPRPGEGAVTSASVLAGPMRDEHTGRFVHGNGAARLRALKRAPKLTTLNPKACATWARPFVALAAKEAAELAEEVGAERSASLMTFAEDAATAVAMHRAFMAIALAEDVDPKTKAAALGEARQWMKDRRQSILSLRAEARAGVPDRPDAPQSLPWLVDEEPKDEAADPDVEDDEDGASDESEAAP